MSSQRESIQFDEQLHRWHQEFRAALAREDYDTIFEVYKKARRCKHPGDILGKPHRPLLRQMESEFRQTPRFEWAQQQVSDIWEGWMRTLSDDVEHLVAQLKRFAGEGNAYAVDIMLYPNVVFRRRREIEQLQKMMNGNST